MSIFTENTVLKVVELDSLCSWHLEPLNNELALKILDLAFIQSQIFHLFNL